MAACLACIFWGRGKYRLIALTGTVIPLYLWGFLARSGSDIDAFTLPICIAIAYTFANNPDRLTLQSKKLAAHATSKESGQLFSAFLMIFIIYYFTSGLNKLIHISILDWFTYDLIEEIELYLDMRKAGY